MFGVNSFHLIAFFAGLSLVALLAMVATSFLKLVVVMGLIRNALAVSPCVTGMDICDCELCKSSVNLYVD